MSNTFFFLSGAQSVHTRGGKTSCEKTFSNPKKAKLSPLTDRTDIKLVGDLKHYVNSLVCKLINSIPFAFFYLQHFSVKLVLNKTLDSIEFLRNFPEVIFHDTRFMWLMAGPPMGVLGWGCFSCYLSY